MQGRLMDECPLIIGAGALGQRRIGA